MKKRDTTQSDVEDTTFDAKDFSTFGSLKQTRHVSNFMSNKIDLRHTLRKYKRELNAKFPDPEKKNAEEPISPTKSAKPPAKEEKGKAGGKDKKGNEASKPASTHDEEENAPFGDLSELDSVIDDEIDDNLQPNEDHVVNPLSFTQNPKYMYGAPIPPEVMDNVEELPTAR